MASKKNTSKMQTKATNLQAAAAQRQKMMNMAKQLLQGPTTEGVLINTSRQVKRRVVAVNTLEADIAKQLGCQIADLKNIKYERGTDIYKDKNFLVFACNVGVLNKYATQLFGCEMRGPVFMMEKDSVLTVKMVEKLFDHCNEINKRHMDEIEGNKFQLQGGLNSIPEMPTGDSSNDPVL